MALLTLGTQQCDQIGRFFGFWATFQRLWQQLFCPNLPHSWAIFVKVSKSLIFLVKSFLGNFYRHLAIFIWSHWSTTVFCKGRRMKWFCKKIKCRRNLILAYIALERRKAKARIEFIIGLEQANAGVI